MATRTITFVARQDGIPSCGVVNLKFTDGDLRAEYKSGTETFNEDDSTWSYQFWVQEEDLPGSMVMSDVKSGNVIAPLWSCKAEDDAEEEEDECVARNAPCFAGLPIIEELEEGDLVGIFRLDEECETLCLHVMDAEVFKTELESL